MPSSKRRYHQYCGVAKGLDVVGERWTLLIVRDLLLGPWRYSDLLQRMDGITTNLLAKRLGEMEENGLIEKVRLSSLGSPHVYQLTSLGYQLEPAILALGRFGLNFMACGPQQGEALDPGRALLSLKTRYSGKQKGMLTFEFAVPIPEYAYTTYQVSFSPDYVDIRFGRGFSSDTTVSLDLPAFGDMAFRGANATELEVDGRIVVDGERKNWGHFLNAFGFDQVRG